MADIDLLKVWERGKSASHEQTISVDLERATRGRSRSTLQWIAMILWIELGLNIVVTPFIYVWWRKIGLTWQFWAYALVVAIYIAYYIFLILAIRRFDFSLNVREGLKRIYGYLRFYLLHYKVVIWVIFPAAFLYGIYIALEEEGFPELTTRRIAFLTTFTIVFNAAFSSLFNWLINTIYGKKIRRLKGMIAELEAAG